MRRTRKWAFVEQEAKRLAELGLSGYAIAKQLDVNESSVSRWVKAGKLKLHQGKRDEVGAEDAETVPTKPQTPEAWEAAVRGSYALDATDDQLVTLGAEALRKAHDEYVPLNLRLQAMGRFQAIVKQLRLVARSTASGPVVPDEPKRKTFAVPRRSGGDPRAVLTAVK